MNQLNRRSRTTGNPEPALEAQNILCQTLPKHDKDDAQDGAEDVEEEFKHGSRAPHRPEA
jgi:hypothetical protein